MHWCSYYIIGIFMYKVYHQDIPRVFENYYTENRNVHDYATRQVHHIHIAYAGTSRRNMTMRFRGGKVWNSIVRNKTPYNGSIYIFKRDLNHSYGTATPEQGVHNFYWYLHRVKCWQKWNPSCCIGLYTGSYFPMVASDWLCYISITIDLLSVFDCSVMYPWFLSKCELDLQNAWILYFTDHLIRLCDEALLSISKFVHAYFCSFLHHYCTLLWYIISDKNSGAHKSPMVSCPIGIYRLMLFIRSL